MMPAAVPMAASSEYSWKRRRLENSTSHTTICVSSSSDSDTAYCHHTININHNITTRNAPL